MLQTLCSVFFFAISYFWLQNPKPSRKIGIIFDKKTTDYARIAASFLKNEARIEKSEIRNFQIQVHQKWYIDKAHVILILKILDRMELHQRDLIQALDRLVGNKLTIYYIVSHPSHSFRLEVQGKQMNISKSLDFKKEIGEIFSRESPLNQIEKPLKKMQKTGAVLFGVVLMLMLMLGILIGNLFPKESQSELVSLKDEDDFQGKLGKLHNHKDEFYAGLENFHLQTSEIPSIEKMRAETYSEIYQLRLGPLESSKN